MNTIPIKICCRISDEENDKLLQRESKKLTDARVDAQLKISYEIMKEEMGKDFSDPVKVVRELYRRAYLDGFYIGVDSLAQATFSLECGPQPVS